MKLIKFSFYLILSLILLSSSAIVRAEGVDGKKGKVLNKTTGTPATTKFNINNISTFFTNDGASDLSVTGDSGFQFPIGSGKTVFYESGFLYGGYVNAEWRVGGSTYSRGQVPGRILPNGLGEGDLPHVRIYRVRRDYKDPQADYSKEISDEGLTQAQIYSQYDKDWAEWPAIYGAPFEDKNNNKTYEPAVDIPGVPGADQTIWFVCNDTDPTTAQKLYGSVGLGIEMQATIWGYNQQSALGDALFRKYTMINKGTAKVDSCYVNMWSDPDLGGDAGDDFAGCDTLLSLGFIYNGDDSDPSYGQFIPSSGFDFMQGPLIKGAATDRAVFKGKYRTGYKNMPMTAFYLFTQSVPNYTDPRLGEYARGALQVRNWMQGKVGPLGTPFIDPLTGRRSMFFTPGDPVTGKGWVDGILFPKQDRRIGAVSGPFTLAVGDTQEVVVGQLAAGGIAPIGRIGAVAKLKFQDAQVQTAYDNLFVVPSSPKPPIVAIDPVTKIGKATEMDKQLIITWGDDAASVKDIESYNALGYKFEGYVVYQLPRLNAQLNEAKVIATYDLTSDPGLILSASFDPATNSVTKTPAKYGTNSGISRSIRINTDAIRGGIPLANGTEYYFVVSSYVANVNLDVVPNTLESLSARIVATPHAPNPGTSYQATPGQVITATNSATVKSDGSVVATVIDPSKVTGASYSVTITNNPAGGIFWNLKRGTTTLLANQTNISGDNNYLITDGLQVKVAGPPVSGYKDEASGGFAVVAGARRWTQLYGDGLHWEGWRGVVGWMSPAAYFSGLPMTVPSTEVRHLLCKGGKVTNNQSFAPVFDNTDVNVSYGYRYMRAPGNPANPKFAPYIKVPTSGSYGFQEYVQNLPFSVWNIDDPANPKRLAAGFLENNVANGLVDGKYWPAVYSELEAIPTDNTATGGPREWLFIFDDPYTGATTDAKYTAPPMTTNTAARIVCWATWNRRDASPWVGADQWALYANKPLNPSDVFSFTAPTVTTGNLDLAKSEVEKITAFPNPYYGVNPREVNKYQRMVTFSHLPQVATLRIFNLAGQLVRVLQKNSPSQFTTWDLVNDSSFPVASGLYIVHIDMPELGTTKIVKLAIIQEQQILDHF